MRYEIRGETLPVVILLPERRGTDDHRGRSHVLHVAEYERDRETSTNGGAGKALGRNVRRRKDFSECRYGKGRKGIDRFPRPVFRDRSGLLRSRRGKDYDFSEERFSGRGSAVGYLTLDVP